MHAGNQIESARTTDQGGHVNIRRQLVEPGAHHQAEKSDSPFREDLNKLHESIAQKEATSSGGREHATSSEETRKVSGERYYQLLSTAPPYQRLPLSPLVTMGRKWSQVSGSGESKGNVGDVRAVSPLMHAVSAGEGWKGGCRHCTDKRPRDEKGRIRHEALSGDETKTRKRERTGAKSFGFGSARGGRDCGSVVTIVGRSGPLLGKTKRRGRGKGRKEEWMYGLETVSEECVVVRKICSGGSGILQAMRRGIVGGWFGGGSSGHRGATLAAALSGSERPCGVVGQRFGVRSGAEGSVLAGTSSSKGGLGGW